MWQGWGMWSRGGLLSLSGGGCQWCPGCRAWGIRHGRGAREVQERGAWHDDATPAVLGVEGAHFAPRRSEIYVFPLEIRVPTRPGLERLVGHGRGPRSGEREAPGQSQQASEGGECGAAEPRPVGTVAEQEGGVGGGPSTAMGLFSTRGPGRTQTGDCIFRASCLSWPYKFFVTRWVL